LNGRGLAGAGLAACLRRHQHVSAPALRERLLRAHCARSGGDGSAGERARARADRDRLPDRADYRGLAAPAAGMGVAIALDDFGIGYSSLTSLEQLPITRVKLDRMLVEGVDSNPRSA